MGIRVVRTPEDPHHCDLPKLRDHKVGTIVECEECHKQYKKVNIADGYYEKNYWRKLWFRRSPGPQEKFEE